MKCQSERICVPFMSLAVWRTGDLGNHGRTSNIEYHALVFMLHGLYNKWKQPLVYYLMDGGTKGEMLVNFLMEVLDTSHNEVLEVDCRSV
jgi:hypothetical protein